MFKKGFLFSRAQIHNSQKFTLTPFFFSFKFFISIERLGFWFNIYSSSKKYRQIWLSFIFLTFYLGTEIPKTKSPAPAEAPNKETGNQNIAAQTFTFRELATATRNFRQECLIGEGGFGRVYKGRLEKTGQVKKALLLFFLSSI